jgi:hypothetical protein
MSDSVSVDESTLGLSESPEVFDAEFETTWRPAPVDEVTRLILMFALSVVAAFALTYSLASRFFQ